MKMFRQIVLIGRQHSYRNQFIINTAVFKNIQLLIDDTGYIFIQEYYIFTSDLILFKTVIFFQMRMRTSEAYILPFMVCSDPPLPG